MPAGNHQAGFSYLLLLAWLSVLALMLLRSQDHLQTEWRQEREAQLLFAGDQIREAIQQYRDNPAGNKCFPVSFQQLLSDRRFTPTRYLLRQHYRDPFTQKSDWGMIYDDKGRWTGVYSKGAGKPLKKEGFAQIYKDFKKAGSYTGWKFKVDDDLNAPLPASCNSR
ncbi:type II secretion system protein [Winslowiella iniecta]|nr:type II secretion system protein [Winslowiella iniecta]